MELLHRHPWLERDMEQTDHTHAIIDEDDRIVAIKKIYRLEKAVDYAAERISEMEKAVFCGDNTYSAMLREHLGRPIRNKEAWKKRILDEVK